MADTVLDPVDLSPGVGKTGVLVIPTYDQGHATFKWDKKDPKDVEVAREAFIKNKAKGYLSYRVDPKTGDKGELIKEFDPDAQEIIMLPPMAGG